MLKRNQFVSLFIFVFCLAIIFSAKEAFSFPVLGDFNGDGASDLSYVLVNRDQATTTWRTRVGEGSNISWNFNKAADALVSGHWHGDQKYYPGIVYVKSLNEPLEWKLKKADGTESIFSFGSPGDEIPNQSDLDCDGVTDLVVARRGAANRFPGFKLWYVSLSGSGNQVIETLFGLSNDKAATADLDGDGCGELVVLRDGFYWFNRKLFGSEVGAVQWGLNGDLPLLPQDLNNDGRADYIVSRLTGSGQVAYVRYAAGNGAAFRVGSDSSIPQIGKFRGNNFFAWSERSSSRVLIANPNQPSEAPLSTEFGASSQIISRPDGTVVLASEDGRFGGGSGGGVNPLNCNKTEDFKDGPNGSLWKPISESTKNAVFLLASSYWSGDRAANRLEVLDKSGNLIVNARRRSCCGNGGRSHFDVPRKATVLKKFAPITVRMFLNDNTVGCRTVSDPTKRYD